MSETVAKFLSEDLFQFLQQERFVLLGTIDHESGIPVTSAISWIFAPTHHLIRIAVDSRSRIVANIKKEPKVVINLFGNGSTYSINGLATVAVERMEQVPIKLSMIEVAIETVRDVMFYGSRISLEPQFEKTYNETAAAKLDQQVMAALRKG